MDLDDQIIKPIALKCLAYPSDLALNKTDDLLYVCETLANRVLKFYVGEEGNFIFSVFHQFHGRLGPTAITVSKDELIYVA